MDVGEKCAVCGKGMRKRDAIVFYFHADKIAGAWHARCGPLPHIEGTDRKDDKAMSERREWKAKDADEVRLTLDYVYVPDAEAKAIAEHFGYEVSQGMPEGDGYWTLEPRCVIGQWYRKPGEKWSCLDCAGGSYAFDSDIRLEWLMQFHAKSEGNKGDSL